MFTANSGLPGPSQAGGPEPFQGSREPLAWGFAGAENMSGDIPELVLGWRGDYTSWIDATWGFGHHGVILQSFGYHRINLPRLGASQCDLSRVLGMPC